jgi:hypothetical protein
MSRVGLRGKCSALIVSCHIKGSHLWVWNMGMRGWGLQLLGGWGLGLGEGTGIWVRFFWVRFYCMNTIFV